MTFLLETRVVVIFLMSMNDLKRLNSVSLLLFYWDKISHYMAQSDLEATMSCLTHAEPQCIIQFLIAFSGFWSTELVCSKATHITIFWDSSFQNLSSLNMLVGLEFKIGNYFQILTWYISAETTTRNLIKRHHGDFLFPDEKCVETVNKGSCSVP